MKRQIRSSTYAIMAMSACWIGVFVCYALGQWAPGVVLCVLAMLHYMTHLICRAIEEDATNG